MAERGAARRRRVSWRGYWTGWLGLGIVTIATICAIFAPRLAPHDPYVQDVSVRLAPPVWAPAGSAEHILGTDHVGRDYLSRIIYGARVSLATSVLAVLVSGVLGVLAGVSMGYYGGLTDRILTFLTNLTLTFPFMLLAIATIALMGSGFVNMVAVLGLTAWPIYARIVRGEVLSLREREFVVAGIGLGGSTRRILWTHILPNLGNLVIVLASVEAARMIIVESFLSYLGLGVPPPAPSWGGMLSEAQLYVFTRGWMAAFPGLAIFVTVLGINLVGDALRDYLDPQMKTVTTG